MHRTLRSLPLVIAAASLLAPAAAHAATKKPVYPKVSSVAPLKVKVGATLTIKGTGFRAGKGKTTVVFQRTGKPAVFVKATTATTTKLTVRIPEKLGTWLAQKQGLATATQFKLRVLTTRFARSWTTSKTSPTISPKVAPAPPAGGADGTDGDAGLAAPPEPDPAAAPPAAAPAPPAPTPEELCQAAATANGAGDEDHDGLTNAIEKGIGTDPCMADTDGDGVTDGYEYQAAKDLNGQALPYPGKEPWPNPLDPTDTTFDFDGDGLTMGQEYALWAYKGSIFNSDGTLSSYSDGTQNTGGHVPAVGALAALDLDGDHNLTDDERDADGDGLSNMVEDNYTGIQSWWAGVYTTEKSYTLRAFSELDATKTDTNGNGVPDGLDDQDNDGYDNIEEMQESRAEAGLRVQPFNPCLPDPYALTCSRWIPLPATNAWPPFDSSQMFWDPINNIGDTVPFVWPHSLVGATTTIEADAWTGHGGPQGP
jgi:hypothetical protein